MSSFEFYQKYREKPYENYPRPEERVKIKFETRAPTHIPGTGEIYKPNKTHEAVIYKSDLEKAKKKVEDQVNLLERAQKRLDSDWKRTKKEHIKDVDPINTFEIEKRIAEAKQKYTNSLEAEFFEISYELDDGPRGIKPVKWIEEVQELDPPKDDTFQGMDYLTEKLSQAVSGPKENESLSSQLKQELAEVQELKQKLMKELESQEKDKEPKKAGRPKKEDK